MSELDDLKKENAHLKMELLLWKKGDPKFRVGQVVYVANEGQPNGFPFAAILRRMRWNEQEKTFEYTNQSREMEGRRGSASYGRVPTRWFAEAELRALTSEEFIGTELFTEEPLPPAPTEQHIYERPRRLFNRGI